MSRSQVRSLVRVLVLCNFGRMAELADALALGASEEIRGGSNPLPPIIAQGDIGVCKF